MKWAFFIYNVVNQYFKAGFPKQGRFLLAGGKFKILGNFKTYTRYSWVPDEKQKKVLGTFISNFETYNRYSWVADEEQKKSFRCVKEAIVFLNTLKRAIWKKSLGNHALKALRTIFFTKIKNENLLNAFKTN